MLKIKAYISKYDLQGLDMEIPDTMTSQQWEEYKQQAVQDFINNFDARFRTLKNHDFSTFGQGGIYADNVSNRRLNRVGLSKKDRGVQYREAIKKLLNEKEVEIQGGYPKLIDYAHRQRWTQTDDDYIDKQHAQGHSYVQIAKRLGRTASSIYSRNYRRRHR